MRTAAQPCYARDTLHTATVPLQNYIPDDKLSEVKRVLYGANQGGPVQKLEVSEDTLQKAQQGDFDFQAYRFRARQEQNRKPRKVKIGLIQNSIKAPTTAPYAEQTKVIAATAEAVCSTVLELDVVVLMQALYSRIQKLLDTAGETGAQIVCLQEAWTMPFAFCTREREWLEFAEPAETGPSTKMLQAYAQKYNMVIINSILERDEAHGETIWNTAVVIGHMGNVLGKHRKVLLDILSTEHDCGTAAPQLLWQFCCNYVDHAETP